MYSWRRKKHQEFSFLRDDRPDVERNKEGGDLKKNPTQTSFQH